MTRPGDRKLFECEKTVECSSCFAAVGQRCATFKGKIAANPHPGRWRAHDLKMRAALPLETNR